MDIYMYIESNELWYKLKGIISSHAWICRKVKTSRFGSVETASRELLAEVLEVYIYKYADQWQAEHLSCRD